MNDSNGKLWIAIAAASGAIAVAAGAFGAHGFDPATVAGARARDWLQTGSHYEIVHALAMLAVVLLSAQGRIGGKLTGAAQWLFLIGSVLFPGSLYALAFGGPRWFGAVAPFGGTAFILGWLALALAALSARR
ncbi:Uncharacterized membrane protein YgdD, TMEM256/DUF423 family [Enhydrobacter aerosaccus]|uniref:Uncharacterized membrane protein YgdD, TMEM256/DUF423 family n=1 Tax=Enhydrobacter aerosaccus TaxID=225324 RepID=A0A1T4TE66_9HYPH|nr:DUF423 domain-containing protein [Enhydrobacter aerosaccus]SKA38733.1 Uncharacterized membrane protein YgdD, TMEM256/DUF423 family [Enhydrobacter aerosaccus]